MTIDEAKERDAFQLHWCPPDYDEAQGFHVHKQFALDAWLARAAQPVRVSREALESAFDDLCNYEDKTALRTLGIEVVE